MYFHTDDARTIDFVERVVSLAQNHNQSLRIDVDDRGNLRIKRGEGIWSIPIPSTPDAHRYYLQECNKECPTNYNTMNPNASHYLGCRIWNVISEQAWKDK